MNLKTTPLQISENPIHYSPSQLIYTEALSSSQSIPIDGPYTQKPGYALITPMETKATANDDKGEIAIETVVYINSSHDITSLKVFEEYSDRMPHNLNLFIEFDKTVSEPTSEFISYLVKFAVNDIENLKEVTLFLKSSNPRTSRGTITTVKRPM